jgi:glycosyltransferase involved in cell wall biosynthesis
MKQATVLITSYNYGAYIERAVRSALNQTFDRAGYEVVVVDDGSTDDTLERLKRFGEEIRLIQQPHAGLPTACNSGITAARGKYLMRLDADDELTADALAASLALLDQDPQAALVISDRWEIDRDHQVSLVRVNLANIYTFNANGNLFRMDALRAVGGYRQQYWEEHDLMIRMRQRYPALHLQLPIYRYYLHGNGMTAGSERRRRGWAELLQIWGIDALRTWGHSEELESVWADMEGLNYD